MKTFNAVDVRALRTALFGKPAASALDPLVHGYFPRVVLRDRRGGLICETAVNVTQGGNANRETSPSGRVVNSSKHRIYVRCPHCMEFQPAGRLHQHYGSQRCRDQADATEAANQHEAH